jgi:hypothetical protein
MPVRDDFIVAPRRDQLQALNDVRGVEPDLMVRCVRGNWVFIKDFPYGQRLPGERSRDHGRAHCKVSPDPDYDQPLSVLSHAEIGHVHELRAQVVAH